MWANYILLAGICAALAMSVIVTVPYILVWNDYNMESREMNVVTLKGETYVFRQELANTVANVTVIAIYPKASVNAYNNVFTLQLVFIVELERDINSFLFYNGNVYFHSSDWSYTFFEHIRPQLNEYSGSMAPFLMNYSITLMSGRWPPIYASNPSYFAGTVQVFPNIALNGAVSMYNSSYATISFLFDMKDRPITIYCYNYPLTLWATYGSSIIIGVVVSTNYLLARRRLSESRQATVKDFC